MFITELEKARAVDPLRETRVREGAKAEVTANIVVATKAVVFIFRRFKYLFLLCDVYDDKMISVMRCSLFAVC